MEIITGVERHRRWRVEEKLRIVAEAEAAGSGFAAVARRYDVSRGQLWTWRRQFREGSLAGGQHPEAEFLPVRLLGEPKASDVDAAAIRPFTPPEPPAPAVMTPLSRIEILLPNGLRIRTEGMVDAAALRIAIAAAKE